MALEPKAQKEKKSKGKSEKAKPKGTAQRLFVRGVFLGFRRGKTTQHPHTSLIKIKNVEDKAASNFYLGKRIAYIYKVKSYKNESNLRVIWGKATRPHGSNGVVRAKFKRNLPPNAIGKEVQVMLYPSRI